MNADPPARSLGAPPAPATANRLDVAIEWASGATAVGMFAYGYALSYSVLYGIAVAVGLPAWAAKVWPLGFESFMASAALNALAEQRHRRHLEAWWRRVPWYPWTLTALTAGASILLNWFHPAIPLDPPPGWLRSLVYGLPPLAAVFAWHLFLQRVAHRHARPAASEGCSSTSDGLTDTTVQRLDTPSTPDTPRSAVDTEGVRALSAPDTPSGPTSVQDSQTATSDLGTQAATPPPDQAGSPPEPATASTADTPAAGPVDTPAGTDPIADTPGVQPSAVSGPGRGRVRDRLAAVHATGRPDGTAWTARTLAQAAGCGRSTAAAFLRDQRQAAQQAGGGGS